MYPCSMEPRVSVDLRAISTDKTTRLMFPVRDDGAIENRHFRVCRREPFLNGMVGHGMGTNLRQLTFSSVVETTCCLPVIVSQCAGGTRYAQPSGIMSI